MAYRREQTSGMNDSRTSSIPLPASAMKQSQQNIGLRGPRKSNFGLPSVIQRGPVPSTRTQPPPSSHLLSASTRTDYGKTPVKPVGSSSLSGMGNLSRRSIGGGGNVRSSRPGLPYTSAVTKEARPIREKSYQQKEQREILEYLNKIDLKNQIPTLSIKTLQSPTAREFFDIWMRLVQELDPDYSLPPNKKVEDEFQQVMKDLLYPHAEQISRTSLATPNAPHAWPAILASLHWMVQTIEIRNRWLDGATGDPYMKNLEDLEAGTPELPHILQFDFLAKSYHRFWEGKDNHFEIDKQELVDRYDQYINAQNDASEKIELEIDASRARLDSMKSKPRPLNEAIAEKEQLLNRVEKFKKGIADAQAKVQKTSDAIALLEKEIESKTEEVRELLEEQQRVRSALKAQNLSDAEIARMNNEHESYSKATAALSARLLEAKGVLHGLEVALTHRTDAVEEDIAVYMALLVKCGLHPSPPDPVAHINFSIDLNVAKSDPREMSESDIRGTIKPALLTFKSHKIREKMDLKSEIIELEELLERLQSETEDIKDRINTYNEERNLTLEQIETMKEKMAEEAESARVANIQLERNARELEDELSQGRGAALARRKNLEIEFETTKVKVQKIKEEIKLFVINACETMSLTVAQSAGLLQELEVAAAASDVRMASGSV